MLLNLRGVAYGAEISDRNGNSHPGDDSSSDRHSTLDFAGFIGPLGNSLDNALSPGNDIEVDDQNSDDHFVDAETSQNVAEDAQVSEEATFNQDHSVGEEGRQR